MHEKGNWTIENGEITHKDNKMVLLSPALIINVEDDSLAGLGEYDTMSKILNESILHPNKTGKGNYVLVYFNEFDIEKDDVCSIINFLCCSTSLSRALAFLSMGDCKELLKSEARQLQKEGY